MTDATTATIPPDMTDLLTGTAVATVASHRSDGSIAQHQMWVDFDGTNVIVGSAVGSQKARNWARDPAATLTVVDPTDPWRSLVVRGRVVEIRPDRDLALVDRLSQRYVQAPYRRRDLERELFVIRPEHVQARRGR